MYFLTIYFNSIKNINDSAFFIAMPYIAIIDFSGGRGGKIYGMIVAREDSLRIIGSYARVFPHFSDLRRMRKARLLDLFPRRLSRVERHIELLYTTRDLASVIQRIRSLSSVKLMVVDGKLLDKVRREFPGMRVMPENKGRLSRRKGLLTLANILDIALNVHRLRHPMKREVEWVRRTNKYT